MSTFSDTPQQSEFLSYVVNGQGNAALVARAGCGKTSTILRAVDVIRGAKPHAEILICAYNKSIGTEISEKLVKRGHTDWRKVQCQTLHALGFSLLKYALKLDMRAVDDKKVLNILRSYTDVDKEFLEAHEATINSLVKCAKGAGFGVFSDAAVGDANAWAELAEHFDLDNFDDDNTLDGVISIAQRAYSDSARKRDVVDYDDMVLLPLLLKLRVGFPKDFIFIDEAQDLSRIRQALAMKFVKPSGRVFIVGDDRQAIYGFSGADSNALFNMVDTLNAFKFPLTVTWRCPKAVVGFAQALVPDIEAADTAPEGSVQRITAMPDKLSIGDAILCRSNRPLVQTAYKLIRARIPCRVEGRAIGDNLVTLCRRWKVQTIAQLLARLKVHKKKEIDKAVAKGNDRKIEEIEDRIGTLETICAAVQAENKQAVNDAVDFIKSIFSDDVKDAVVLCSMHRSKGREWDNVYIIDHEKGRRPRQNSKQWEVEQLLNLHYVAYTRAKRNLYLYDAAE